MRHNRNRLKERNSRKLSGSNNIVDNILNDKEDQSKDNSNFGSGKKYLNEEALDNEDYVKENEYDERHEERYPRQGCYNNCTSD